MIYTGYNLMWMMFLFDLPTSTKQEQKNAAKFRNSLLDYGFEMMQFSVYLKFCGDRSHVKKYENYVKSIVPKFGKITIIVITDKQFGDIINIYNYKEKKNPNEPEQYQLF